MDDNKYFMEHKNDSQRRWFAWIPILILGVLCVCCVRSGSIPTHRRWFKWTLEHEISTTKQMHSNLRMEESEIEREREKAKRWISEWKKALCAKSFDFGKCKILWFVERGAWHTVVKCVLCALCLAKTGSRPTHHSFGGLFICIRRTMMSVPVCECVCTVHWSRWAWRTQWKMK